MSLLSRLDRKFGRYAVPNLTVFLIAGQVLAYVVDGIPGGINRAPVLENIRLMPGKVMQGEVWRLVTFLFDPPVTNIFFAFFFWYLFYLMGTTLEGVWGNFRYNVYLAIGYFASIVLAMLFWFAFGIAGQTATNTFLYGSVFLAFARLYPDFELLLFFILPVKIKWFALVTWIWYAWSFMAGTWIDQALVAAAVLNYLLFFGRDIWQNAKHGHRRMQHQAKSLRSSTRIVHKCRVCGLSSDEAPQTQFRYCSQCEGECCYCSEHLQDHEHVTGKSEGSEVRGQGSKAGRR
jgi:hypothetical protein